MTEILDLLTSSKKKKRGPNGAPRWMVTFADLMALLFALFVLLLSFSEINSDKFRKNAGPISQAFYSVVKVEEEDRPTLFPQDIIPYGSHEEAEAPIKPDEERWKSNLMYQLRGGLARQITDAEIEIVERDREIIVRFPETSTFGSGSADLHDEILPALDKLAQVLTRTKGRVTVSGYTDNVPIATARFRSNWELSTSRAVSVLHRLLENRQLDPARISAQGFGPSQPIKPNDTAEHRALNRRVEVTIAIPVIASPYPGAP